MLHNRNFTAGCGSNDDFDRSFNNNNNNNNNLLQYGSLPGGSGYFTCIQNMKSVSTDLSR